MQALNLDELTARKHTVSKGATVYPVEPITVRVLAIIDEASGDGVAGVERVRRYCDAVALILPTMPREEVESLTMGQLLAIVSLSTKQVEAVEEAAGSPNGSGSAPATTIAPTTEPTAASPAAT